ncbi:MAG TPA: Fis family transcriptional regulator, partial [Desulfobacteraceae bacterium]|nr:Fis family transcriptional regulator [Desulfobacteraceae bacterium]
TLFLDEIGDMNINTQAKMLRALESKTFQRIGSSRTLEMDVRLITSSNKNLETEIKNGNFREDLFYRINVVPIQVPPLRERKADIPMLVDVFLEALSKQSSEPRKTMSGDALELLQQYPWNGNVRELKNLVERLSIMVKGQTIETSDIPQPYNPDHAGVSKRERRWLFTMDSLEDARTVFEEEFLRRKVDEAGGDIKSVAKTCGTTVKYIKKRIS